LQGTTVTTLTNSGLITNTGGISGGGSITTTGAGALTVAGTSTLQGTTVTTLTNSGLITNTGGISGGGSITTTGTGGLTIAGSTSLQSTTTGTLTSTSITASTSGITVTAGGITINGGSLSIPNGGTISAQSNGSLTINSVTITNGGAVSTSGSVTAASFNASSDYRIKQNIVSLGEEYTVDKLNSVIYQTKDKCETHIGFVAHELQEHYPFLVSGTKDGEEIQSVNYIGLIGVLVKEIQTLKKQVKALITPSHIVNVRGLREAQMLCNNVTLPMESLHPGGDLNRQRCKTEVATDSFALVAGDSLEDVRR